jgi:hypothetical protein
LLRCVILEVLLNRLKVVLRRREISRLQILLELVEGLGKGIAALRR